MRPTQADYDRYIKLVEHGRGTGWDAAEIYRRGPFLVADPGLTFVLLRADRDLLWLVRTLGIEGVDSEIEAWIVRAEAGVERLWSETRSAYVVRDLKSDRLAEEGVSSVAFLAWWAGVRRHDDELRASLEALLERSPFAVPSFDPHASKFDALRYWRGPIWAVVNYMIGRGLAECGHTALATRVRDDTARLIGEQGFFEYFDPLTGKGVGGGDFTWTAAIWLAWAGPRARAIDQAQPNASGGTL